MSSSAPIRGTTAQPITRMSPKAPISASEAERRYRIMPNQICVDARLRLDNIRRLMAAAEGEYRASMLEIDSLDREGRLWLAVDFIHKTSLASLDMAASLLSVSGRGSGDLGRMIADGTQTTSDTIGIGFNVIQGGGSAKDAVRTAASRILTHTAPKGAGGAYAKGSADLALTGWSNIDNIIAAEGSSSASARKAEASVDAVAGLIQRTADTLDASTPQGNPTAKKVSAVAALSRSIASYNREIEGVFNRRLEIRSSLQQSRANLNAMMQRNMTNFRKQSAEIEQILSTCE